MKKAIFAIHTEYHLMFALKMISVVPEFKNCDNIVLRISPTGTHRLRASYNFYGTGIEYRELFYNYGLFKEKGFKRELINKVLKETPDFFILFYELHPWYTYLLPRLKKLGTKIILAPDGINLYNSKIDLKRRRAYFFYGNAFLLTNGFPCIMKYPSDHWAYRKGIDAVAVENKNALGVKTTKEIIEVGTNEEKTEEVNRLTNHVFNVIWDNIVSNNSFLWIDQPMEKEEEKRELIILKELKAKYPDIPFYIKPHPRSNKETVDALKNILNATIVETQFPAELMLDNLEKVCVISINSTAMLHYSPRCRYYWIYPMFKNNAGFNPKALLFDHIHVVNSLNDIKPYISK